MSAYWNKLVSRSMEMTLESSLRNSYLLTLGTQTRTKWSKRGPTSISIRLLWSTASECSRVALPSAAKKHLPWCVANSIHPSSWSQVWQTSEVVRSQKVSPPNAANQTIVSSSSTNSLLKPISFWHNTANSCFSKTFKLEDPWLAFAWAEPWSSVICSQEIWERELIRLWKSLIKTLHWWTQPQLNAWKRSRKRSVL